MSGYTPHPVSESLSLVGGPSSLCPRSGGKKALAGSLGLLFYILISILFLIVCMSVGLGYEYMCASD